MVKDKATADDWRAVAAPRPGPHLHIDWLELASFGRDTVKHWQTRG